MYMYWNATSKGHLPWLVQRPPSPWMVPPAAIARSAATSLRSAAYQINFCGLNTCIYWERFNVSDAIVNWVYVKMNIKK